MNMEFSDLPTLEQDATLNQPLRRVAYEAGMMLGLEATRDEQGYHRRRLNRNQYWLHGFGTIAGMAVSIDPSTTTTPTVNETVRVIVGPGVGIDRLGREILIHEPYCISLAEWLKSQPAQNLLEGFDSAQDLLTLEIYARQRDCEVAAQPVLARKLNLSTDAVQPSRLADSVHLEMMAVLPAAPDSRFQPWGNHEAIDDALPATLTNSEVATITAAGTTPLAKQLRAHVRLLYALEDGVVSTDTASEDLERAARLLLARISISVNDISSILVNPSVIEVNNLVRPFVKTSGLLAHIATQP